MQGIVIALEQDIEVTRHHVSMAMPFTTVGYTAHRWNTKEISAYDMMDAVNAKLVICSEDEYHTNSGLRHYIEQNGLYCLIRYESDNDILGRIGCISYTRYPNEQFKEYLPSCADITAYKYHDYGKIRMSHKYDISIKNYINPRLFKTNFGESDKKSRLKIFRGYNLRNEYNCGDLSDTELSDMIEQACEGFSYYVDGETCITSDLINMLHCGLTCTCHSDTEEHMKKLVDDYFGIDTHNLREDCQILYPKDLPKDYTNFDRAIKISEIFGLKAEGDLIRESVKYK